MINSAQTLIAHNRFGYGLGLSETPAADPREWLEWQLRTFQPDTYPSVGSASLFASALQSNEPGDRRAFYDSYRAQIRHRLERACSSATPFVERLVHFWTNHFAVSADKRVLKALVPDFEFRAIRPHVIGMFEDLVLAAEEHPAMLIYLDQSRSVGPSSELGRRRSARNRRNAGLNENFAREILELHTMGVRSGYTQADVTEFARALTGYSIASQVSGTVPVERGESFAFDHTRHEPGSRTVLGKTYPPGGSEQGRAILRDLVRHPATANFLAAKLARHFISDNPASDSVRRIARTFTKSGGSLSATYRALIHEGAAWEPGRMKFKNGWEWAVSALRTAGIAVPEGNFMPRSLEALGHPTWEPGSPAGFPDLASYWLAPDALLRRADLAYLLARRATAVEDARTIAAKAFGGTLSRTSAETIAAAGDPAQGLALFLMCPEFLWR